MLALTLEGSCPASASRVSSAITIDRACGLTVVGWQGFKSLYAVSTSARPIQRPWEEALKSKAHAHKQIFPPPPPPRWEAVERRQEQEEEEQQNKAGNLDALNNRQIFDTRAAFRYAP